MNKITNAPLCWRQRPTRQPDNQTSRAPGGTGRATALFGNACTTPAAQPNHPVFQSPPRFWIVAVDRYRCEPSCTGRRTEQTRTRLTVTPHEDSSASNTTTCDGAERTVVMICQLQQHRCFPIVRQPMHRPFKHAVVSFQAENACNVPEETAHFTKKQGDKKNRGCHDRNNFSDMLRNGKFRYHRTKWCGRHQTT